MTGVHFIAVALLALLLSLATAQTQNKFNNYGEQLNGFPNWQERATLVVTNIARMSPTAYKRFFTPNLADPMTPVPPLYEHYDLVRAARAHCTDMTTNGCFSHNSCLTGTSFGTRVKTYYTESGTLAENIAKGQTSPQSVVAAWIIDAGVSPPGHRINIMSSSYKVMGNGWVSNTWTQDFGGGVNSASNHTVSAAAHLFLNSTHVTFLANVYNPSFVTSKAAPKSVLLYLNGTAYTMSIANGFNYNDDASIPYGTYSVAVPKASTATSCRSYFFVVNDANNVQHVYPTKGQLQITQENSACSTSFYVSTQVPVPPAPSPAKSTVTPTTSTKTSDAATLAMKASGIFAALVMMFVLLTLC